MSNKENLPHPTKLREYLFKRIIKDMVNDFFCVVPLSDQGRLSRYHHELMRFLQRTRSEEFALSLNGAFQNLVGAFTYTISAREKMMTTLNKLLEVYLDHYKLGSCKYPERYEEILQEFREQIRKINSRLDILEIQSNFIPTGVTDVQQLDMETLKNLQEFAARHSIQLNPQIGMVYEHYLRGMETQNLFHVFQMVNCAPSQDLTVVSDCFGLYLSMLKMKCDLQQKQNQSQKQQIFAVQSQAPAHFRYQAPEYVVPQDYMYQQQQRQQEEAAFEVNEFSNFEDNERGFNVVTRDNEFCTDFDVTNAYEIQVAGGNTSLGEYQFDEAENEQQEVRNDVAQDDGFLKENIDGAFEQEFSWGANPQENQPEFTQIALNEKGAEYYQPSNGNESTTDGRDSFTSEMQFESSTTLRQESMGGMNYQGQNVKDQFMYNAQHENNAWEFEETFRLGDI